jgi:lipoprotein NlpI
MSLLIGIGGLGAAFGQAQARLRLRVVPDRGINSAPLFRQRAEYYAQRGMWAMSALHWQKAIARQPRDADCYKSLGLVQVRLGRHAQAVRTFRSGAELAPVRASTRLS